MEFDDEEDEEVAAKILQLEADLERVASLTSTPETIDVTVRFGDEEYGIEVGYREHVEAAIRREIPRFNNRHFKFTWGSTELERYLTFEQQGVETDARINAETSSVRIAGEHTVRSVTLRRISPTCYIPTVSCPLTCVNRSLVVDTNHLSHFCEAMQTDRCSRAHVAVLGPLPNPTPINGHICTRRCNKETHICCSTYAWVNS